MKLGNLTQKRNFISTSKIDIVPNINISYIYNFLKY